MGLFEKIFPKKNQTLVGSRWEPLTAYTAAFTTWRGAIYESELVRSAIDCLARNSGKLRPTFTGSAKQKLIRQLKNKPNPYQTWYQFIYRARTIYEMQNNAIIVHARHHAVTNAIVAPEKPHHLCRIRLGIPHRP